MTLSIRPIDPVSRPSFAGTDITQRLTREQAAEIEKAMDQFGVLVFHNQRFTDETQIAFSRNDAGYQNWLSFMDNYYPNRDRTDNRTVYGCSMA